MLQLPPIPNHEPPITVFRTNHQSPINGSSHESRITGLKAPRTTFLPLVFIGIGALVSLGAIVVFKNTLYYPYVEMSVPGGIDITFLFNGRKDKTSCETLVANVTNSMLAVCPTCQAKAKKCLDTLEPQHRKLLSAEPLDIPSARLPDGVATYYASNPEIAIAACRESERLTSSRVEASRIICYPPKAARPALLPRDPP